MVNLRLMILIPLCLAACTSPSFREPIKMAPHGDSVRANMAAHIINPNPPAPTPTLSDAQRPVLATEKYRTGEVDVPGKEKQPALTGALE